MGITNSGRSPIIMDTAGDNLASIFQGRDMQSTAGVPRLYMVGIEFIAGADGRFVLLQQAGGAIAYKSPFLTSGSSYYIKVDAKVHNLYLDQIPASSQVLLHYA